MSERLKGKTAIITGAAQGIGLATARIFAQEGAKVWAVDINKENLKALENTNTSINTKYLDVTDSHASAAFSREIGTCDVLFNCAGFVHHGDILECKERDWNFSFDLNVKSMFYMIQAFLPTMVENRRGSIINMSSVASSIKGVAKRFIYTCTKAAVIGLTKSVAADFIKEGVRCNAICPGTVQTPSLDQRIAAQGGDLQARKAFIERQPMGRLGTTEEVAALALYLASEESAFTTGTIHVIDGGWSA
ncbi:MAG: SDR family oxidoreductase [Waddliaceae bacterium]